MGAPKSSSKKNPGRVRKLDGKVVRQALYNGLAIGHGKYYVGYLDGIASETMIKDKNGKPLHFHQIGQLEWPVVAAAK